MTSSSGVTGFVVAGTHSGVGKTTASFAIMSCLAARGFAVQPFKIGPDFIDPGYHLLATGRRSVNLDRWLMGTARVRASFERFARRADVAVVEGMGALHDGENGTSDRGSSAYFARHLGLPILLVLDIWGMTRSTAAVIRGFEEFDPRVEIAGLLLNRAGSRRHFEMVRDSLPAAMRRRVVGYLPADDRLAVAERHLGLVTLEENPRAEDLRAEMIRQALTTMDLDRLIARFGIRHRRQEASRGARRRPAVRIGVARDRAFCFYYLDNLERLERAGAELVPFSPLADQALPEGVTGLYIGGGYPESFPELLSANSAMHEQLRLLAGRGAPIYAECGGLMYLGEALTSFEGRRYPMAALLPLEVAMDRSYLAIRYVEIETTRDSLLGPAGTRARGQEFHQSRMLRSAADGGAYIVRDSRGAVSAEGFADGSILGSYLHLHFASNVRIAAHFVERCRQVAPLAATRAPRGR